MQKRVSITIIAVSVITAFTAWMLIGKTYAKPEANGNRYEASVMPVIKYGLDISSFIVKNHVIGRNELFSDILLQYNIAYSTIHFMAEESRDIFNIRKMRMGNNCTMLCEKGDSGLVVKKLIYEENKVDYVVFNFEDSLYVYRGQNAVERKRMEVSGVINSSLYETLDDNGMSAALAVRMADIFAWTIDFYKLQNGDKFKIVYDEDFVSGQSVGIGEIHAIVFNSSNKDYYAFYYEKDAEHEGDYYDQDGNSMKKLFLKSPVKFSRISSKFSRNRFHPVTKAWKAHLGTDYAAPYGTPIFATADGVVEDARFKVYNGNYVKIRHNGQYKTQYLHMSKIAKGVHPGSRVKQGEVIGYVGSTGLATGPHVCYRFWKDGQQVDPLKQKLDFSEPLPRKYLPTYLAAIKDTKTALDNITYQQHNIAVKKQQKEEKEASEQSAREFAAKFF